MTGEGRECECKMVYVTGTTSGIQFNIRFTRIHCHPISTATRIVTLTPTRHLITLPLSLAVTLTSIAGLQVCVGKPRWGANGGESKGQG